MIRHRILISVLALLAWAATTSMKAQDTMAAFIEKSGLGSNAQDARHKYTKEQPLIYEGAEDLWPYSLLNENGNPDGFNVDLIRLLLDKLNIPYDIKMKPLLEAFKDLKEGKSDLMIGLTAGFHEDYGHYSATSVTLFTQSVLSPKKNPTEIHNFHDLASHRVYVNDSSLCHHLMVDYGWGDNAIPTRNIAETIQKISIDEEGELVWNTLSLKWLLRKFQIDNLVITPINMPHGEYRFMSNDEHLLHLIDSIYAELNATDAITPLHNKWFYPERMEEKSTPKWVWYVGGSGLALLLLLLAFTLVYRMQARRITRRNNTLNRRLALVIETSEVHLWTYDVATAMFTWRNKNGQPAYTYTPKEFSQRYAPEDYQKLHDAIMRLTVQPKTASPEEEEENVSLHIQAKGTESGNERMHSFIIVLSVLERDKQGKPTVIIGLKKEVTDAIRQKQLTAERSLRYWTIFNTPLVGIILFDKDGRLQNINDKACDIYQCDRQEIMAAGNVTIYDMLSFDPTPIGQLDDMHATQFINIDRIPASKRHLPQAKLTGIICVEYNLMAVCDEEGEPFGIFAICRDVSSVRADYYKVQSEQDKIQQLTHENQEYERYIDRVLSESDVRMASYSPTTHMFTIYQSANKVQHALTQTRCMSLVDDRAKKLTMRLLAKMDSGEDTDIRADIQTTLRVKGGLPMRLQFRLKPKYDAKGNVVEYQGLCLDFSELRHIENAIAQKEAEVQEVDNAKTTFMKNMVQEIKEPMQTVMKAASALNPEKPSANETQLINSIQSNADNLLHLIENILFLSRLEAHMQEYNNTTNDLAPLFDIQCACGWDKYRNDKTRYIADNPTNPW